MISEKIIESIYIHIKKIQSSESTGHDWLHTERVYNMCMFIVGQEELCVDDESLLKVSALLHDYVDHKFVPSADERASRVCELLLEHGIADSSADEIVEIIESISFSNNKGRSSDNNIVRILRDADRLDSIGAIGIARTFAYGGKMGRPIYSEDHEIPDSIDHFYDKLLRIEETLNTSAARRVAQSRREFVEEFLRHFYAEQYGETEGLRIYNEKGAKTDLRHGDNRTEPGINRTGEKKL